MNNPDSDIPKNEKKKMTFEEWSARLQKALNLPDSAMTIRMNPPQQTGETKTRFIFLPRTEDKKE
ncbi:MAG: hypothetical protein ORN23_01445 [Chthoniobacterales bacterium]|nr:hypothetical protein [Chthoniobacterales bacterium]